MKTTSVLGYDIFTGSIDEINLSNRKIIINTLAMHDYITAKEERDFHNALQVSDILLPKGRGMSCASTMLGGEPLRDISHDEVPRHLLRGLNNWGGSCFFLGSSEETINKIKSNLAREYPKLRVGFLSPSFGERLTAEESQSMIDLINNFETDVLFVGMTAQKQAKWVRKYKDRINSKIIMSLGSTFELLAGNRKHPSQIWHDMHLAWLARLAMEPKRLWRRYLISLPKFAWEVLLLKAKALLEKKCPECTI